MEPVKGHSDEFKALETYVRDTHGATHRHLQVKVMHAYRVERYILRSRQVVPLMHHPCRQAETDAWNNAGYDSLGDGERLLLWHGSRTTNFAGQFIDATGR
jgi:poly [ADP-ribose] polymerase